MIAEVLNKAAAVKLFEEEAVLMGQRNAVPFYRAIELFGEEAAEFFDRSISFNGYMKGGRDWNEMGMYSDERPAVQYLYQSGFLKLVTEHNYLRIVKDTGKMRDDRSLSGQGCTGGERAERAGRKGERS